MPDQGKTSEREREAMILRFILWWISRPRSLYETEMVYWNVRERILKSFPFMLKELNGEFDSSPIAPDAIARRLYHINRFDKSPKIRVQ